MCLSRHFAERALDLGPARRARLAALRQHPSDEVAEHLRDIPAKLVHCGDLFEQDPRQYGDGVLGDERRSPGKTLEHDGPEREHVCARVDVGLAGRLLGRHVAGRAHHVAGRRDRRLAREARDAEVDQLDVLDASSQQEEVGRLDVAMNDPTRMGGCERLGHLQAQGHDLPRLQVAPAEPRRQVFSL